MPRALIVDDSRYQRHLIIQALTGLFAVEEAADGKEGLALFAAALKANQPFDLVVMDILMPVLSGHDALAGIRRLEAEAGFKPEQRTPAVMLSSLDDPANMLRAQFESGAQAYVTKPFAAKTLLEALASLGLADNPLDGGDSVPEDALPCKAF
ncbi:response regulator transcription factor [Desulfovibrio sp. TomC]|uniref:response regulator transcription factor n=1 Tax=Desulfovibrio sp. TomC TaxID=1562888 RepID=UPI0005741A8A|nr:response regulator [Desulfovibrio sp. TomC]KHK00656.1 response regulator receiver domain protein (CheY-like) [Desulfovibrio sp. TomC]